MAKSAADRDVAPATAFRVAFVPGVTPGKWTRIWQQRLRHLPLELTRVENDQQIAVLHARRADMCFVRLPVVRDGLNVIPLYREVPVVVVPNDHPVAAYDEITLDDLADEHLLDPGEAPLRSVEEAIERVAAGTGVVIVPMSLARLHHRKDLTYRPVTGVAESEVGLAWLSSSTDPRVEQFIGIVRGRTKRSSRDSGAAQPSVTKVEKKATAAKAVHPKPRPGRGNQPRRGHRRSSR